MVLKPGQKLHSTVSEAQVVVVRAPADEVAITCGGVVLVPEGEEPTGGATIDASLGDGPLLGKRYVDEDSGLELLCTRGGEGALAADGRVLTVKGAKPLPSSD